MPGSPKSVRTSTSGHRWSYHRQWGPVQTGSTAWTQLEIKERQRQPWRSVWWQMIRRWFTVAQMKTAGGTDEGVNGRTWVMLWQGWKQHTVVTTANCSECTRGTHTTTESPLMLADLFASMHRIKRLKVVPRPLVCCRWCNRFGGWFRSRLVLWMELVG